MAPSGNSDKETVCTFANALFHEKIVLSAKDFFSRFVQRVPETEYTVQFLYNAMFRVHRYVKRVIKGQFYKGIEPIGQFYGHFHIIPL